MRLQVALAASALIATTTMAHAKGSQSASPPRFDLMAHVGAALTFCPHYPNEAAATRIEVQGRKYGSSLAKSDDEFQERKLRETITQQMAFLKDTFSEFYRPDSTYVLQLNIEVGKYDFDRKGFPFRWDTGATWTLSYREGQLYAGYDIWPPTPMAGGGFSRNQGAAETSVVVETAALDEGNGTIKHLDGANYLLMMSESDASKLADSTVNPNHQIIALLYGRPTGCEEARNTDDLKDGKVYTSSDQVRVETSLVFEARRVELYSIKPPNALMTALFKPQSGVDKPADAPGRLLYSSSEATPEAMAAVRSARMNERERSRRAAAPASPAPSHISLAKVSETTDKGTKVCLEVPASYNRSTGWVILGKPQTETIPGVAYLVGFLEDRSKSKIQVRISGMRIRDGSGEVTNLDSFDYNGSHLQPNSIFWSPSADWGVCE